VGPGNPVPRRSEVTASTPYWIVRRLAVSPDEIDSGFGANHVFTTADQAPAAS
jgi:hypothetical protein